MVCAVNGPADRLPAPPGVSEYDGFVASMNVAGPSLANLYVAGVPVVDEVRVWPIAALPRREAQLSHRETHRSSATGASGRRASPPRTASTATSSGPSRDESTQKSEDVVGI